MLLAGHIDAFVVDAGPVFRLFRYTPWKQQASLLTSENRKTPHFFQPEDVPRGPSVAVKKSNANADFDYWVIFPKFSSIMGHFSHFFYRAKKQPAFLKNKKKYDAFYVPAHYCFPGHILKPLANKKKTLSKIMVYGSHC